MPKPPAAQELRPRVAVVTGSSSGMGLACAQRFATAGWRVLGLDVASAPPTATGYSVVVDIVDRQAVRAAIGAELPTLGGKIDVVVNVAGVYPPSTLATMDERLYRTIFDVNVLGTLNVIAECVPFMDEGTSVVNFASVDAFTVSPGQLLYGASKAAVVMLTKALALELAVRQIRVNAVAPGWVDTPGNRATGRMTAAAKGIPLGRVAAASEIADWVYLLADPDIAGFVTGESIVLSGGDVLR